MGHSILEILFYDSYEYSRLLRNDNVIVFVLRYHYVAGENNRMSHHRSFNFFEIRFYDSCESFRL